MPKVNLLPPLARENIAVLRYTPDGRIEPKTLDKTEDKGLKVDLKRRVWSYKIWENIEIGTSRPISLNAQYGIIGVYNRADPEQFDAMAHTAEEAKRAKDSALEN